MLRFVSGSWRSMFNVIWRRMAPVFRTHTGRWEPLPDEGTRDEMLEIVLEEFGPYLMPDNY